MATKKFKGWVPESQNNVETIRLFCSDGPVPIDDREIAAKAWTLKPDSLQLKRVELTIICEDVVEKK